MKKPLILDHATNRISSATFNYTYDSELDLNVCEISNKKVPFIDTTVKDVELMTKTFEEPEQDDDEINSVELLTKTRERAEQDDENLNLFLELLTKTDVQREQDDE